jgi:hypothetical protein
MLNTADNKATLQFRPLSLLTGEQSISRNESRSNIRGKRICRFGPLPEASLTEIASEFEMQHIRA